MASEFCRSSRLIPFYRPQCKIARGAAIYNLLFLLRRWHYINHVLSYLLTYLYMYTVSHKKRATLFSTPTLAFLERFLTFLPVKKGIFHSLLN